MHTHFLLIIGTEVLSDHCFFFYYIQYVNNYIDIVQMNTSVGFLADGVEK